jgi:hypothetical protein
MRGRILEPFVLIVSLADDSAILDDNRAYRHFFRFVCEFCLTEGKLHPPLVFRRNRTVRIHY